MLTPDQYATLNGIKARTDTEDWHKITVMCASVSDWEFLKKRDFVEGGIDRSSTITFSGRVALAAYEGKNVDARSI